MRTNEIELINQAKNEFENLKLFSSELIIKAYEMFINKATGRVITVMEYVEGLENLNQIVEKEGPLPERLCRKIFNLLLEGIYIMHKKGLCHRYYHIINLERSKT
jgi:serine/threonine protein kinase